ncbi:fibronectin type III domain-containing protein [Fibrella arboris]|uniref:fibronectin type III domain-containing protein n=1 Tax=Fibrella arboris TaxID=3242486 RepID=UPI00352031D4
MNRLYQLLLLLTVLLATGSAIAQSNAPTGLNVNVSYGGSICLQWTPNVAAATVYEIERSDDGRSGWNKVGDSQAVAGGAGSAGNYCDQNLPSLRTYYYRVRGSLGRNTYTNYSNTANGTTKAAPPTPAAPTLSDVTANSIKATWSTQLATTYELDMQTAGGAWQVINTQSSGRNSSLSYTINTLTGGVSYCFRVRARDAQEGTSNYSNSACQTTSLTPTNIRNFGANANGSSNSIKLTWTGYGKESGITIERSEDGGRTWSRVKDWLADGGEYTDTGLQAGKEYCYRIQESGHAVSETKCATTAQLVPEPPRNLRLTVNSSQQITLNWDQSPSTFASGYYIEVADNQGGNYTRLDEVSGVGTTEYVHRNLTPSRQYCYRVKTKYNTTLSNPGNERCETTQAPPITLPSPPTELALQVVGDKQITLRWKDNSDNETNFAIERSTDGKRTWQRHKEVDRNTTSYDDGGLNANTEYCYRVFAYNTAGNSRTTDELCNSTQAPPVVKPSAPARLSASAISSSQIRLEWANTAGNATGIQVERSETGSGGSYSKVKDLGPTETNWTDGGLSPAKAYCYRIRAVNGNETSDFTEPKCATTQAPPVTVPAPPTELVVQAVNEKQLALRWKDNSDNETGFAIERSTDGKRTWQRLTDVGPNSGTFDDGNLAASATYCYRVLAFNLAGSSRPTDEVCATTQAPPVTAPARPTDLKATATSSTDIALTWTDNSPNETRFELQRSLTGNDPWETVDANLPPDTKQKTDGGRVPSTRYYYRVRAVVVAPTGASLYSDWSDVANDITQALPLTAPDVPRGLNAVAVSSTEIRLTWTDGSANESGFEVEQSDSQTGTFVKVWTTGPNASEYTVGGLQASRTYCFQVRAVNAAGRSAVAGPACATTQAPPLTPPTAPLAFNASAASTSQINLSWTDNSNNETGFDLQWSTASAGPWTSLPTQASNVTTFAHTGLSPNTRYYYQLRATNTVGSSVWVTANAITPALPVPSTTADLKAEVADYDQIKLTWGAITNTPAGIVVERSTSPTGSFIQVGPVLPGTATTFTDTGLPELTTFYYRIRSTNANGQSGNSNIASAKTPESIIAVRPQPLPEGIYAHVDRGTLFVTLNWNQFKETQLRVIGLTGRELLTDQCRVNGGILFQYDVAHLPAGVYVLCLDTDKNRFTKKIWIP